MIKRYKKLFNLVFTIGTVLILVFFISGCRLFSLSFVDFPVDELKKFDESVPPLELQKIKCGNNGESTATFTSPVPLREITGSGSSTVRSSITRISWNFQPYTFFVNAEINGTLCTLVIDTGATVTLLFPSLAKRAQIPVSEKRLGLWDKEADGQGNTNITCGWTNELKIGDFTIDNIPVLVSTKEWKFKILEIPVYSIDGLLGTDILKNFVLKFDMTDGSVQFSRDIPTPASTASQISFHISNNWILCEGAINGQAIGECLIDTGSSSPVLLPESVWNRLQLSGPVAKVDIKLGDVSMKNVNAIKGSEPVPLIPMNVLAGSGAKTITIDFIGGQHIFIEN